MKLDSDLINRIIADNNLITVFQPLISMKRKTVLGYEALSRGINPDTGEIIPPDILFNMCSDMQSLLALDRACRKNALTAFFPAFAKDRTLMLSMNIDASLLGYVNAGAQTTLQYAKKVGIPAGNIIMEIIESKAGDEKALEDFVSKSRSEGFLIALDDVGTGHSNLDRIPRLQPDIIKIDRSLIASIDASFHNFEITGSLIRMAHKTGTLPLAEGVETLEEALTLMRMDVDVFQGYYFGRPDREISNYDASPVLSTAARFKSHTVEKLTADRRMRATYEALAMDLRTDLENSPEANLESIISAFIDSHRHIECAYLLNERGIQTTQTICNPYRLKERRRFIYNPAPKGADHSLKEYYLSLYSGTKWHITRPYISLASGNRCLTVSTIFIAGTEKRILCVDITMVQNNRLQ